MRNNFEQTSIEASLPVASIGEIRSKFVDANNRGRSAVVHLTQDLGKGETFTIPSGQSLTVDLRGFAANISFVVSGDLTIVDGSFSGLLSGTGTFTCNNVSFVGSSVASGNISNSSFNGCSYPSIFSTGIISHTVIDGTLNSVETEMVVGSAANTPIAIKVDLAGGLNCFDPLDSNISITGDFTNIANLGTNTNILARNVSIIPAIPSVSLDGYLMNTLADGYMWIGNSSGIATPRLLSQDATISNTGAITIANDAVTFAKMQNSAAGQSVLGKPSSGSGDFSEIVAGTDGYVLTRRSGVVQFSQLSTADISGLPTALASNNRINYSHKTADYSVQYEDTGITFTNYGATSLVNFTLPAATTDGYVFSFVVDGYTGIRLKKTATNIIFINGQIIDDTNPGYWESYTPGDYVELTAWDGYTWNGTKSSGVFLNSIGNTHLRDSAALSVMGRSANSSGDPADIIAASDGYVLRRSGTTLGFGEVAQSAVSGLTASLAAKVTGAGSATDNAITRFDGTTGSLVQNSSVLISDTGELSGYRQATVSYTSNQTLTAAQSGTRFDNKGSTGTVILTLPTPAAGLHYWFFADTNNTLRVQVGITATHYLMIDGYVSVGYFETSTSGDSLYIYASDTLGWQGFSNVTLAGNRGDITVGNYQRTWTINNDAVTFAKMQNSAAGLSVVGRPTNSSGDFSEIVAGTDGYYLRRNGTSLEFGPIPAGITDHTLLSNIGTLTHAQIETSLNNKVDISAMDGYLGKTLADGYILVGNSSNIATPVLVSADATISNAGALTIANDVVTFAKMQNSAAGLSVLGKPTAGSGDFSEIIAASDGYVLKYTGGEIKFAEHNSGVTDHTLLSNIGTNTHAQIDSHIASTSNPHSVTKSQILTGNLIVNADIEIGADIALTKLDTVTPSMALVSDADGYITAHGTVSATEIGYLDGVTSAIQTQLNGKEPTIAAGTTGQYWRGDKSWQTLDKSAVGLSNVDNTSDLNKPISTATQTALDLKADKTALDGYVVKAASSTDNAVVRWDGTSGRNIQNSSVLISDSDEITGLRRKVTAKTADYTVLTSDSDTLFTNRGATSQITFTLPAVQSGLIYHFISYESQGIKIKASSGNALSFRNDTTTIYVDGYLLLGSANDAITLVGQDDGYMYLGVDFVAADSNTDAVSSVFGRTGAVVAATNDYTWAQINKATSSIADITTRSHTSLTDIGTNTHAQIDTHIANTSNPHAVTKSQILTGNLIVNSDIAVGADIALTKLDTVTPLMALVSDADGYITAHATVSATELGYLDGVTSAIQTQLNNKVDISVLDGYLVNTTTANSVLGRAGNTAGIVAPIQATVSGTYLGYDGTNLVWSTPSGAGDVSSSISSTTANRLARFDGTTGKLIKDSVIVADNSGNMQNVKSITGATGFDFQFGVDSGYRLLINNGVFGVFAFDEYNVYGNNSTYTVTAPKINSGSNTYDDVVYGFNAVGGLGISRGNTNEISFISQGARAFAMDGYAFKGNTAHAYTPQIATGASSTLTPLYTSADDTNTGLAFGNNDTLHIVTGSTNTFQFRSSDLIGNSLQTYVPFISMGTNATTSPVFALTADTTTGLNFDGYATIIVSQGSEDFRIGNSKIIGAYTGGATSGTVQINEATDGSLPNYTWTQDNDSGLAYDSVPYMLKDGAIIQSWTASGAFFDKPFTRSTTSSTSTSSIVVDGSLYMQCNWIASHGSSPITLSISNLATGQQVEVFCKNTHATNEPALTVEASSSTSGYVNVKIMSGNGNANVTSGWSLPGNNTWTRFKIYNRAGDFIGEQV